MTGMQCYFQCFDWNNKCSRFRRARVWGILTKTLTRVGCESCVTGRGGFQGKERSRRMDEETSTRHTWEWAEWGLHHMSTLTESQLGMDLHGSMKEPQPCDPIMGPAQSGQCAPNGDMCIFYLSGIAKVRGQNRRPREAFLQRNLLKMLFSQYLCLQRYLFSQHTIYSLYGCFFQPSNFLWNNPLWKLLHSTNPAL